MNIPLDLLEILDALIFAGAYPYLVGGCVRDHLMMATPKDFDVEVFNIYPEQLGCVLSQFGNVDLVGKSFGVFKLRDYDFSVPRKDNKVGAGHKGFTTACDPNMSLKEAASRRDFTINSILYHHYHGTFIDLFNGQEHIKSRLLHPTSPAFKDDLLRPLRGFQFAGRFNMEPSKELINYAEEISPLYHELPKERIWGEWEKWAAKSITPSKGLNLLLQTTWINHYPPLAKLINCPQDPEWHPEPDGVWGHTLLVCDAMSNICQRQNIAGENKVILMLAALCHDLGKPKTTYTRDDGRIVSPGHAEEGVEISRRFLTSIGTFPRIIDKVLPLVKEHLSHIQKDITPRVVRRLANRLHPATIKELSLLTEADHSGRPPLPGGMPGGMRQILDVARQIDIENSKPQPILMGRDLISLGYQPGKTIGRILDDAFEAQLNGVFNDKASGLQWIRDSYPC